MMAGQGRDGRRQSSSVARDFIVGTMLWATLFCFVIGVAGLSWSWQRIRITGFHDPILTRSLWSASISTGYGVSVHVSYLSDDQNGFSQDPFCGSNQAESFYAKWIPALFVPPGGPDNATYFPPEICCSNSSVLGITRDSNTNDWCDRRRVTSGFAIAAICLIFLACIVSFTDAVVVSISLSILSAIVAVCACISFGVWFANEGEDIEDRDLAVEGPLEGGYSFGFFLLGTLLVGLASLGDLAYYITQRRQPDGPYFGPGDTTTTTTTYTTYHHPAYGYEGQPGTPMKPYGQGPPGSYASAPPQKRALDSSLSESTHI